MTILDRRGVLGAVAGVVIASTGAFATPALADTPVSVVATTGMIADVAREIGGDAVSVKALMGPGVDPHAYRQTRTDIVSLAKADLVLWNGLYLEAQMEEFLADLTERTRVVAVAEAVSPDALVSHDDYQDRFDPHVWMNPALWRDAVIATRDALIETAPEHSEMFTEAADAYLTEVEAVGTYATEVLASVPENAPSSISKPSASNSPTEVSMLRVKPVYGTTAKAPRKDTGRLMATQNERRRSKKKKRARNTRKRPCTAFFPKRVSLWRTMSAPSRAM